MKVSKIFMVIGLLLIAPLALSVLQNFDPERGALWLMLYQLYYLPFSTILGEDFFVPDRDLGFVVTIAGQFFVAIAYCFIVLAGVWIVWKFQNKSRSLNSA